ncbi:MAG TPA: hypothetical protein VMA55_16425 [Acidovorax sp.]|nr:hypothetical protein [Acidovorax sp.]
MPVPSSISQLSQTPGSNSPAGSESPALLDDYIRTVFAFIATLRDGQGVSNPVDLASAATTDIGAQTSPIVRITGTTTITSFGANYTGPRFVVFGGALTLTNNATSLILPTGANITTAAGDACIAIPNLATPTGWRILAYQKANGEALIQTDLSNITGTLAIAKGGTGQTSAAAAFNALKQGATTTATGVVELATNAEALAGTDTDRPITPAAMRAGLSATGSAPIFAVRAWCTFNAAGNVAAGGNVTSVTKIGTGRFQVNFATALPSASYAAIANSDANSAGGLVFSFANAFINTSSSCLVSIVDRSEVARDPVTACSVMVIG